MLTPFNRRELAATYCMARQAEIRSSLAAAKIDYQVKVVNHFFAAGGRARTGSLGQKMDSSYEYLIYVHKKDLDQARFIIQTK